MKKCWDMNPDNRPNSIEIQELISSFNNSLNQESVIYQDFKEKEKKENHEIEKQFKEAQEYRKANPISINNDQLTTHPQAIYTSRLLNPFTKNLPKYDDNTDSNTAEITDFTKLF